MFVQNDLNGRKMRSGECDIVEDQVQWKGTRHLSNENLNEPIAVVDTDHVMFLQ